MGESKRTLHLSKPNSLLQTGKAYVGAYQAAVFGRLGACVTPCALKRGGCATWAHLLVSQERSYGAQAAAPRLKALHALDYPEKRSSDGIRIDLEETNSRESNWFIGA